MGSDPETDRLSVSSVSSAVKLPDMAGRSRITNADSAKYLLGLLLHLA